MVTVGAVLLSAPLIALASTSAASASANAVIPTSANPGTSPNLINNYQQVNFAANDDGTWPCGGDGNIPPPCTGSQTGPELYPIGFSINFFGQKFSSVYVNNNGNLTFSAPLPQYTPSSLTTFGSPIIAPFFADVDTRGGDSATVNFGTGTLNGNKVFVVNWPGVGCYDANSSVLDDFQLILIDRPDRGTGPLGDDFDMEFNYNSIQWDTGQASTGDQDCQNGQPGDSAFVGYSNGTSTAGDSFNLPGSGVPNAFLDSSTTTGLIYNSLNSTTLGRYLFSVHNGQPPQNTTLTTSLSGGGQNGASISVPPGTAVTGNATVSNGSNNHNETGTVTYNVYSDAACTNAVSTGSAETIVTPGTLPASQPVTLTTPGVYYWQAVYSGDTLNNGSLSTCGSDVETVSAGGPAILKVCKVAGSGVWVGEPFAFTAGSQHFTVPAGPAPGGYCVTVPGRYTQGEHVTIAEQLQDTLSVTGIKTAPAGRMVSNNVPDGITTVALGTGVTETTFTNAAVAGSGYTEICDSSPPERNISDVFTYAGRIVRVPLNACSPPLRVHAGDLTIHEMFRAGLTFGTCRANPERLLLRCNQSSRTAVIAIVPGNVSTQTIARFLNT